VEKNGSTVSMAMRSTLAMASTINTNMATVGRRASYLALAKRHITRRRIDKYSAVPTKRVDNTRTHIIHGNETKNCWYGLGSVEVIVTSMIEVLVFNDFIIASSLMISLLQATPPNGFISTLLALRVETAALRSLPH